MIRLIFKRLLIVQLMVSSIAVLGNTIDSVIVARMLGAGAIAACGLINPFAIMTAAISDIIVSGTQVVCSKSIGAGNISGARKQLGIAFATSMAISAAFVVVGYLSIDQLCLFLGAEPGTQLFYDTGAYARGLLPSLIPSTPIALMMFTCMSNGDLMRCRIGGIGIVCLNIVFSIVSIVLFDGGLFGVGLATAISTYLVFFYLLAHFRKEDATLRPSFSGMSGEDLKQIVLTGSPRATLKICTFLLILLFNNILLDFYGQEYVAAYSIVRSVYSIVSFTVSALVYCTSLITSTFFGEENRRALYETIREFTRLSLIVGISGFVFVLVFNRILVLLFLDAGTNIYATACSGLIIISAALPFCAAAACLQNFFVATGHKGWGAVLNIIADLVLIPAAGLLLMPVFDALFVYASFPAGYFLELIAIGIFAACRKHRSPFRASTYLFAPDGFGVPKEQELSFEVRERSDLAQYKTQFERFCQDRGFSDEKSRAFQVLSLFVGNCIKKKEDRKGEACFVRTFCKDGTLNLIIWNTFGMASRSPFSQIINQGKEVLHGNKPLRAKQASACPQDKKRKLKASDHLKGFSSKHNQPASKPQSRSDERKSRLGAGLTELLENCEYSLSNPFGLEKLRVAFEAPNGQKAQGNNFNENGSKEWNDADPAEHACTTAERSETPMARDVHPR